ncbi:MAG: hypothetical protein KAX13_02895 [Candidatus Krumholzibacteria bacterium]|nr:hypothetical protein [Candidatus Krumholzibacteria bacterium]
MRNPLRNTWTLIGTGLSLAIIVIGLGAVSALMGQSQGGVRRARLEEVKPDEPMTLVFPTFLHTWGMQRAGSTHLRIFLNGRTRFDNPQGIAATVLDAWDDPQESNDDDEPTIYGVNSGRGEIIYNTSMFSLGLYGSRGSGVGQFFDPHGIDADPAGNLVVADTGNDRIAVLFNNGRVLSHRSYLRAVGENDSLKAPYDVVLTPAGGVWVSDTGNGRLVHFNLEGGSDKVVDLSGIVGQPGALALSHPHQRWSYYRHNAIYLASREGDALVMLDAEGTETARVSPEAVGQQSMSIRYIATDFYSNVWATDGHSHSIHKFDRNLNYLATFGSRGRRKNQFESPRGIGMWRRFGQIFIADSRGAQYYWVGADAFDVAASQEDNRLTLDYTLTEHSYVTVRGRYVGGGLEVIYRKRFRGTGRLEEVVTLEQERPLGWLEVVVEPTYSSYTYREKVFHLRFFDGGSR